MKLTLILIFFVLFLSLESVAANCGKIVSMRGKIEILRLKADKVSKKNAGRSGIIAKKPMKLWCSDIVITRKASRAKIRLKNSTSLTLGPHSRLEIENYTKRNKKVNALKLTYGKVRSLFKPKGNIRPTKVNSKSKKSKNLSRLRIRTPSAVAGVRGTDFYIGYSPIKNETEQATISGEVEVENSLTGQKVRVTPGSQVKVKKVKPALAKKIKAEMEKGKSLDEIQKDLGEPVVLLAKPIEASVKEVIRQTSVIAKKDKRFTSKEAVAILGQPESWSLPPDEIPLDLKDLKEEF